MSLASLCLRSECLLKMSLTFKVRDSPKEGHKSQKKEKWMLGMARECFLRLCSVLDPRHLRKAKDKRGLISQIKPRKGFQCFKIIKVGASKQEDSLPRPRIWASLRPTFPITPVSLSGLDISVLFSLHAEIWPHKHPEIDVTCQAGPEQSTSREEKGKH